MICYTEELASWNYPKDIERQMRELKSENKDELKALAKLEKAAAKTRATADETLAAEVAKAALQSVLDQLTDFEAALVPYETVKEHLAEARARFRNLTDEFVNELKSRCDAMTENQKRDLVLELFEQDVQTGLATAVVEKRQGLARFIEGLWDKYRVTLTDMRSGRADIEVRLTKHLQVMDYV